MIYYVEDDKSIRELVVYTLKTTGFEARGFENGKGFFAALAEEMPELILLDIMLPDEDGIRILKKIRAMESARHIPVILLTAKGTEYDKVIGLDSGADDYITKPFGMMELVSRIKAVLRRSERSDKSGVENDITIGCITLNEKRHQVTVNGEQVVLAKKEFDLLKYLMENQGIVLTRDKMLETIWGYDFDGETRTVDVHVRTLRQKLGEGGALIETVRGVGYRIEGGIG
ncbi:MAG: response regulator transcription factor [Lachnospiraceae bacterium]|nr:response regulator transcription factor [Lachnospiraceae bacterium]